MIHDEVLKRAEVDREFYQSIKKREAMYLDDALREGRYETLRLLITGKNLWKKSRG